MKVTATTLSTKSISMKLHSGVSWINFVAIFYIAKIMSKVKFLGQADTITDIHIK
jgi:hypothetical protein